MTGAGVGIGSGVDAGIGSGVAVCTSLDCIKLFQPFKKSPAVISPFKNQLTLLLTTIITPPMDLGQLISQGIKPEDAKFIIIKAAVSHKDAYDPIASHSFYIDSKGLCTSNLKRLPFKKIGSKVIAID